MIKVTILYPAKAGAKFDFDYYLKRHMPMSIELQGPALRGVTVERGLCGVEPGSQPAFVAGCHFFFDSMDAFMDAFMPHAEVLQGDIRNYTDIEPVIQFSEVEIHQPLAN
jgi:uncharacterized protein (TIGR02118 family)